jgi:hypothetical protein
MTLKAARPLSDRSSHAQASADYRWILADSRDGDEKLTGLREALEERLRFEALLADLSADFVRTGKERQGIPAINSFPL